MDLNIEKAVWSLFDGWEPSSRDARVETRVRISALMHAIEYNFVRVPKDANGTLLHIGDVVQPKGHGMKPTHVLAVGWLRGDGGYIVGADLEQYPADLVERVSGPDSPKWGGANA